jgi:hypothetical protein
MITLTPYPTLMKNWSKMKSKRIEQRQKKYTYNNISSLSDGRVPSERCSAHRH